jgi:hypothetical protein
MRVRGVVASTSLAAVLTGCAGDFDGSATVISASGSTAEESTANSEVPSRRVVALPWRLISVEASELLLLVELGDPRCVALRLEGCDLEHDPAETRTSCGEIVDNE